MSKSSNKIGIMHGRLSESIDGKIQEFPKHTWKNEEIPQMITGQLVGNFLQLIIHSIQAKKILF